jgi:hypothetical protein
VARWIRNPTVWLTRRWSGAARWIRTHAVALAGLALIAGQLGWTAALLAHSYFRQTDFVLLDRALREGFGWKYLMWADAGHLMPGGLAVTWSLARISLYSWPLASSVVMVLVAAASLAMLRMLLTVFARPDGASPPGILIPLAVYLFAPLSAGAVAWLSVALRVLPLQLAMFMAVSAHIRYLRGGRPRQLIASAVWLVIGMASADQGALVPILLFVLTVAYFEPGRLRDAAGRAAVRYWRAWTLYGALLAAYCVIFFIQLGVWGVHVAGPGKATSLYRFAGTMLGTGLLPGILGGPWQWQASGYAQAAPPAAAEYLSWVVVAIVVLASCLYRASAWRAWAILLGWIVAACIAPAAIGGFGLSVTALGEQTGYLANATGVLALCLGLAFLPAGEAVDTPPRPVRALAAFAFCCFVAGTVASLQDFESVTSAAAARSYIATARLAVADAPRGTLVVDGPTPATVMDPGFFSGQADTARVIGPLARHKPAARPSWISALDGVYTGPMTFDAKGRLRPVIVTGLPSRPPPKPGPKSKSKPGPGQRPRAKAAIEACWNVTGRGTNIPLKGTLYRWPWTARLAYSGPAGLLSVTFGRSGSQQIAIPAGTHVAYVPVTGSGNVINVRFAGSAGSNGVSLCVASVTVGLVYPDQAGRAIPATPSPG